MCPRRDLASQSSPCSAEGYQRCSIYRQSMPPSLALPPSFLSRKARVLSSLSVPEGSYTDASPKGSVDEGIRNLISWLNGQDGYVTTSSCAGRISVFAEGNKDVGESRHTTVANTSGKGGGGRWLFVSHEPVNVEGDIHELLGIKPWEATGEMLKTGLASKARYIRFAFEPMVSDQPPSPSTRLLLLITQLRYADPPCPLRNPFPCPAPALRRHQRRLS